MEMITWLQQWLANDDYKIIYFLTVILSASIMDFLMGWLNAKFNKLVSFSSTVALFGIAKKIVYFMLLVLFIPIALLVPDPVGIAALYVLYTGYLASEIQSVFSHLNLAEDSKKNQTFLDFINTVLKQKNKEN